MNTDNPEFEDAIVDVQYMLELKEAAIKMIANSLSDEEKLMAAAMGWSDETWAENKVKAFYMESIAKNKKDGAAGGEKP